MLPATQSHHAPMPLKKSVENNHPPIDMAHLGRFTMKDRELEREILDLFVETLVQTVKTLTETQDQTAWHMAAHTLKGSARAVGAWQLAQLMEIAEKLVIGSPSTQSRQDILADLNAKAADTMSYISKISGHA